MIISFSYYYGWSASPKFFSIFFVVNSGSFSLNVRLLNITFDFFKLIFPFEKLNLSLNNYYYD